LSEAQGTIAATVNPSKGSGSASVNGGGIHAAIARAAQATGVDFQFLLAQARIESSFDAGARADTSSAAGLFQFTNGTWLDTLGRHGADHGMGWVQQVIAGGGLSDPGMRARIMGLRYDAQASALMAAELARDNRAELTSRLGREPDAAELYLAHFLGSGGAGQFLSALATDPGQSAASVLPAAAAANRGIFYEGASPRSLGAVMDHLRGKMADAMSGAPDHAPDIAISGQPPSFATVGQAFARSGGPVAQAFGAAASSTSPRVARLSMAETLRGTFDLSGAAAPAAVRAAYDRLAGLGL
jgi:hypothetical protein